MVVFSADVVFGSGGDHRRGVVDDGISEEAVIYAGVVDVIPDYLAIIVDAGELGVTNAEGIIDSGEVAVIEQEAVLATRVVIIPDNLAGVADGRKVGFAGGQRIVYGRVSAVIVDETVGGTDAV